MNDAWGYDDTEQTEPGHNDGPKALRDAYNALKKQNEDLNGKLTSFLESQQKRELSSVFSDLGVPGAADLYQGEPDPEKAKAWAESMKAAFGTGTTQGQTPVSAEQSQTSPLGDEVTQQQFQQMTEAGQNGVPLGNFQAAEAAVGSANDLDSLIAAMNAANQHNPGQ